MGLMKRISNVKGKGGNKNSSVPEFTVTMLGPSGSGKTVYMHAFSELFRYANVGLHKIEGVGTTLEEKLAEDEKLRTMSWTRILQDNRGKLVMPQGTNERLEWQFQLTHANQPLCRFNWIDYRGGAIEEFSDGTEDAKYLMQLLARSDAIIMFIDAIPLFYYEDQANRLRWSGADTLIGIINSYSTFQNSPEYLNFLLDSTKERHLAISVVVSKCDSDLISDQVRQVDFVQRNVSSRRPYAGVVTRFLQDCNEMIQVLSNNISVKLATGVSVNWYPAIIPVGAFGEGYVKTTIEGEDDQMYEPDDTAQVLPGNSLKRYFHPFNPPTVVSEFSPPSSKEFYPKPANAASPLLWVLDKLLQSERRKGLFKKQGSFQRFANWVSSTVSGDSEIEIEADKQTNSISTRSVVESAVIFPVQEFTR